MSPPLAARGQPHRAAAGPLPLTPIRFAAAGEDAGEAARAPGMVAAGLLSVGSHQLAGDPLDGAARSGVVGLFPGLGGWIRGCSGRIRRVVVRCWWCGADGGGVERARSCWSGVSGRLVMTLWWALAGGGEARRSWLVMACRCEARRPVAAWCSSPRRRSSQARSALAGGEGSWPAHGR